jgi:hypothetical protein
MSRLFTDEQIKYLKSISHLPRKEMAVLFNDKYQQSRTPRSMQCFCEKHGLFGAPNAGRFKKGLTPWNKGTKGLVKASNTSFKKGNVPHNQKPIGYERRNPCTGFMLIKIAEPNVFIPKHHHVWKEAGREIPEGHFLVFKDLNKLNFDLDNLMLMKISEMLRYNQKFRYLATPETNETCLLLGKLKQARHDLNRGL